MPETPPPAGDAPAGQPSAAQAPAAQAPAAQAPAAQAPAAGQVLPLGPSLRTPPRRPLPDAVAVRRITVPQSAPPYDDELPAALAEPGRPGQPDQPVPAPAAPAGPARLPEPARQPERERERDQEAAPAAAWPSRFAQVLAETLAGSRPPGQITPWTTEQARRQLRRLGPTLSADRQPRVRRVLTSCPAADVIELTAVVAFGPRVRALAVRLERDGPQPGGPGREPAGPRWRCTTVECA